MSALAEALLAGGAVVSGSDRHLDREDELPVLSRLRRAGVALLPQNGVGVRTRETRVVVSTAIEEDNPDLVAAREEECTVLHRAELLAQLMSGKHCLAITGTSGKTTVAGMLGWVLAEAGLDPTVVNGGVVTGWVSDDRVGNFRAGVSELAVIEADESDRSLLRFRPEWAIITNISLDHFELSELKELFTSFAGQVQKTLFLGPGVGDVLGQGTSTPERVELPALRRITMTPNGFVFEGVTYSIPVMGEHNLENALAAVVVARHLGVSAEKVQVALAAFPGIERRLELVGHVNDIRVLDDYAHNPAKIRASWTAVAQRAHRVLGIWRPHGYGPLRNMMTELVDAFGQIRRQGDRLYLLPVYDVGGSADRTISTDDLAARLGGKELVNVVPGYAELEDLVVEQARPGDAVLFMGARDPGLPLSARRLVVRLESRYTATA